MLKQLASLKEEFEKKFCCEGYSGELHVIDYPAKELWQFISKALKEQYEKGYDKGYYVGFKRGNQANDDFPRGYQKGYIAGRKFVNQSLEGKNEIKRKT